MSKKVQGNIKIVTSTATTLVMCDRNSSKLSIYGNSSNIMLTATCEKDAGNITI